MITRFLIGWLGSVALLASLPGVGVAQTLVFPYDSITYNSPSVWHPQATQATVLFRAESDTVVQVRRDGVLRRAAAPTHHDYIAWLPDSGRQDRGRVFVSHEITTLMTQRPELGQGGSGTVFDVERLPSGQWRTLNPTQTHKFRSVDFTPVGWTVNNCGGTVLPNGMILSAEEAFHIFKDSVQVNRSWDGKTDVQRFKFQASEAGYRNGQFTIPADYPEFGGRQIPLHQNFGFMVLIHPDSARAVHKLYHAGRFSHESAVALPDNRTLILTDDFEPAVLFKFVADEPGNFLRGNLYAFQQRPGEHVGRWFQIPRVLDSLLDARNVAIRMGATLFMRLEWAALDPATGNVYISETGVDQFEMGPQHAPAGLPPHVAQHIRALPNVYEPVMGFMAYPFGSLLVLEHPQGMDSTVVRPLLVGGPSTARGYHVANFDGLSMGQVGHRRWLVVQEDLIGLSQGRMPEGAKHDVCEAFLLDLSIPNPTLDDLHRVFASSQGSELTGGILLADGTLLINNQHPKAAPINQPPYDRCATIALQGLGADLLRLPPPAYGKPESPTAQPLFAARALGAVYFDAPTTAELHDAAGQVVRQVQGRDFISVAGLPRGTYQLHLATQPKPYAVVVE